jgi:hypothetical protein
VEERSIFEEIGILFIISHAYLRILLLPEISLDTLTQEYMPVLNCTLKFLSCTVVTCLNTRLDPLVMDP